MIFRTRPSSISRANPTPADAGIAGDHREDPSQPCSDQALSISAFGMADTAGSRRSARSRRRGYPPSSSAMLCTILLIIGDSVGCLRSSPRSSLLRSLARAMARVWSRRSAQREGGRRGPRFWIPACTGMNGIWFTPPRACMASRRRRPASARGAKRRRLSCARPPPLSSTYSTPSFCSFSSLTAISSGVP